MNRFVNVFKAPAHRALIGGLGAAKLSDRADGPAELRGGTDAERTEVREEISRLVRPIAAPGRAGAARSDRWITPPGIVASCGSWLIFPEVPARFFAASAPDLYSQVLGNQRPDFLAVEGRKATCMVRNVYFVAAES